ncbi:MAG: APC family permease [Chitinophagales bacterium]|nr:APC family permease [Chitinophagales bacterium]
MQLQKKIGLVGGIALVTGGVVGMGIYVMIASIAAKAGNAVWLPISLAMLISITGVVPLIQISSAIPVAGGGYFYCSRLLHPLIGTLVSWWGVLGGAASTCVVSVGLGEYLYPFLPFAITAHQLAAVIVIAFYVLYLFGLKLVTWLQIVMSLQMLIALLIYIFGVGSQTSPQFGLDFPNGTTPVIMAVILSFNVCIGFQIITEMGEEMRDARRNIPLSLLFGGIAVLFVYVGVGYAYIGSAGENLVAYSKLSAPLIESCRAYLPEWAIAFIGLGAITAGLTSLNAAAITLPREIFAQARDNMLPAYFQKISGKTNNPNRAVALFFIIVLTLIACGQSIDFYGYTAASGVMLLTVFVSIASLRLKKVFPQEYANSYFKISSPALVFFVLVSVLTSLGLVALLFLESKLIASIYLIYTLAISVYFFLWKKMRA